MPKISKTVNRNGKNSNRSFFHSNAQNHPSKGFGKTDPKKSTFDRVIIGMSDDPIPAIAQNSGLAEFLFKATPFGWSLQAVFSDNKEHARLKKAWLNGQLKEAVESTIALAQLATVNDNTGWIVNTLVRDLPGFFNGGCKTFFYFDGGL